ncbi:hypothetical protein DPMN_095711 [Dreissena polymorpha]|uniref:Uncharacterized protein n=1 Tax=Dreissena polymorpha TaxID=45954 RepID=A0A9D4L8H6_DREPO|nr:hypothetical protein DPMN_095711 [Dreissena polymorpha]
MNRGKLGLHRESIKMFNTSGMNRKDRQRPARHREQPGRHREQPGWHRSSTGTHTDPGRATTTPW